jgi:hypothetical protein
LDGAFQLIVAEPGPADAVVEVGIPGAVGEDPPKKTTVAIAHTVWGPVPTDAAGVAPFATDWSSTTSSMSGVGATLERSANPDPAVKVSSNPESA